MVQFNFNDMNAYGGRGKFGGKPQVKAPSKLTPEDVKALFIKYKIEMVCVGVLLVGIMGIWSFFSSQMTQITTVSADVQLLTDKEQSVTNLVKSGQEDLEMQAELPPALEDKRVITYLTSLAVKRDIRITSMPAPKEKFSGFFRRKTIELTCSADTFQNILLFLNDIEFSKYALKVDSWSVTRIVESSMDVRSRRGRTQDTNPEQEKGISKLLLSMTVSSIEILDNEKKSN